MSNKDLLVELEDAFLLLGVVETKEGWYFPTARIKKAVMSYMYGSSIKLNEIIKETING